MSIVNMVFTELSTELNEDRIAPNITAAKKPMTGWGTTRVISAGYASSIMDTCVPSMLKIA